MHHFDFGNDRMVQVVGEPEVKHPIQLENRPLGPPNLLLAPKATPSHPFGIFASGLWLRLLPLYGSI
jgi:hypothetical protein